MNSKKDARIWLDMDGVLADFIGGTLIMHGREFSDRQKITTYDYYEDWGLTKDEFWEKIRGRGFWYNLGVLPWAKPLVELVRERDPNFMVCTIPSKDTECIQAKLDWLQDNLGVGMNHVAVMPRKWQLAAPGRLLIDDNPVYTKKWIDRGGDAILFNGLCKYNDGITPGETITRLLDF